MMLDKIEPCHLKALKPEEKDAFMDRLYKQLARLDGGMRNELVEKTMAILDKEFIWEHNHNKIVEATKNHLYDCGTMPSKTHLAIMCKLNRKTVAEHLKAFSSNEARNEQRETMNIVRENVMGAVIKIAMKGNLKAAQLYLDNTGPASQTETAANHKHNYIQINNTVINQQVIQQLKPEQLQMIEQIIAGNGS